MATRRHPSSILARAETATGLLITLLAAFFHGVWALHAGALWRDEVVSFYVATEPSLGKLWGALKFDSFPALLHVLVRGWVALRLGTTDAGLRVFGLLVGVSILGALWWNARTLGFRVPLLSLALFAMSALTIQSGDSLRSYGLGILLTLLAFGALFRLVDAPTRSRFALATVVAILSVHCVYQNAFFLLALCAGGAIVALRRGLFWRGALVAGVGAAAAVSMLPYLGIIRDMRELRVLLPTGLTLERIWKVLGQALSTGGGFMLWVWLGLLALGFVALLLVLSSRKSTPAQRDLVLYAGTALIVGAAGYQVFLRMLGMQTEPWYYLPPMALASLCLDAIVATAVAQRPAGRALRLASAVAIVGSVAPSVWSGVHVRQTNVDLIASQVQKVAGKDDLILVYPWFCGATFSRYYRGETSWTTLPPHEDLRLQRLDLIRKQMVLPDPIQPVLDRIGRTLAAGNRVFLVGGLPVPPPGQSPPRLPPAPNQAWGWKYFPYTQAWAMQTGDFIRSHGVRAEQLPKAASEAVSPYEDLEVYVVRGWRPS